MVRLGIQELLVLLVIGLMPFVGVAVVLLLVLRSRGADGGARE